MLKGEEVQLYDSARIDGSGTPGSVISVSDDGVTVQADGGRILLKRVRPSGGGKMPAAEWAAAAGLSAGDQFDS
jgi:methionyl-tRNA formyltransferase